ncbi:MAG: ComEC family competence protein [Bacteroidales bacterium]|nr:ComEC family competence protein [Bacteroidales bacterium]
MVGIIISINFNIPLLLSAIFLLISVLLFITFCFNRNYSKNFLLGIFLNLILLFFGMLLTKHKIEYSRTDHLTKDKGLIIGEISKDPKITDKHISLNIDVLAINHDDTWISSSGRTLLYLEKDSLSQDLRVGDMIVFSPELSEIQNKGNPEEFDYKKYLSYNLIYSSDFLSGTDWSLLETSRNIKLKYKILRFRTKLISTLNELGLDNDELAVVSALALGYKDNLSNEIRHSYSSSGAMHILAVSGLHVGIVYGMLMFFLSFMKTRKLNILKIIIVVLFIWFYAMLTGLSPSVSRASLMFTIAALGSFQKHKSVTLNSVAVSAFILLVINPLNIVDIGFQLSYLAVIGIILIQPRIYALFDVKNKFLKWFWSLTTVSIAAQLFTAPLCVYYFNQFSNYFLLTNYILIPVSTVAIWLCIITFVFSGVTFLGLFFADILVFIVKFMNMSVTFIESLPFSVSSNLYINLPQMLILYAFIISIFIFFFVSKRYKDLIIAIVSLICFSCISLFSAIQTQKQKYFIVYNINNVTAINLIDGRDNIMFANLSGIENDKISFTAKNNWLKKGLNTEKYIDLSSGKNNLLSNIATISNRKIFFKKKFIGFKSLRIFVLDDTFILTDAENKIHVDYIILSNNPRIKIEDIIKIFDFDEIIIDSSNSNYFIENLMKENIIENIQVHNVKTEGAFVLKTN